VTGVRTCALPIYFFEDDVACLAWARLAFDAALRNPARHRKKKS